MTKTLQDYIEELKETEKELLSVYQQIQEYIILERNTFGSLVFKYRPNTNKSEIPKDILKLINKFSELVRRYNYILKRIKTKSSVEKVSNTTTSMVNTITDTAKNVGSKTAVIVKQTTQKGMLSFLNIQNIKQSTIGNPKFSFSNRIRNIEIPNEMKMFFTIIAGLPILYFTFAYLMPLFYNFVIYILLLGNGIIDNVSNQISDGVSASNTFPLPIDLYTIILTIDKLYSYLGYFFLFTFGAWILFWIYKVIKREYLVVAKIGEKIQKLK
ncbi:MAG: hypothetical protein ABGW69_00515 [Nanoarchaeota archaeon]